jgi:haloacetate dehalogenase
MQIAEFDVDVEHEYGGTRIRTRQLGSGEPLLLLHGFPETGVTWSKVAARLAEHFSVVVPDLRGYGASGHPEAGADHSGYSFRAMAADQVALMSKLGYDDFHVAGHDRGGRVAHRLALDHGNAVRKIAVLDILPTQYLYDTMDKAFAEANYHWFFLVQPEPMPELMVGDNPERYVRSLLHLAGSEIGDFDPQHIFEYVAAFNNPAVRHAMFEDYRAAATVDLAFDLADKHARRLVNAPLLVLWAARGANAVRDPIAVWKQFASSVQGDSVDSGHFMVDERPDEVYELLKNFFAS